MEFNTESFTVKVNGVVHTMSYPTVKQIRELDSKKDDVTVDAVFSLVSSCGMPEEVLNGLQSNHLNQLVEKLVGKIKAS